MGDLIAFLLPKKVYKRLENQEIFYSSSSTDLLLQGNKVSPTSLHVFVAIQYLKLLFYLEKY